MLPSVNRSPWVCWNSDDNDLSKLLRPDLTSCQESRKYDSLYRFMARNMGQDFATVKRLANRIGKRTF